MNTLQVVSDHMYPYKTLTPVPKGQIQFSKVLFYLSDDWSERSIIAQFKQGEKVLNRSLNSDNSCYIPSDFDIGLVTVYLKGYGLDGSSVATANGVSISIVQGAFDGGEPSVPPEPDLYAKLIEEFSKGIDQERISTAVDEYLNENPIQEKDPTVPEWAKQPQKPAYTAQEVGALPDTTHIPSTAEDVNAEPSGAVAQHNVSDAAHSDIRLLIQGLSERLSAVADSDDATLDQLSEIVAYIKSNRDLISAITTSKVNVADIVDNLTTNVANKPLSAAQGVALKAIIDALTIPTALSDLTDDTTHRVVTDAEKAVWNAKSNFSGSYNDLTDKPTIPEAYTLPIASSTKLGGVKPVAKTDAMTQAVGVDESGALWAPPGSGGGSGGSESIVLLNHIVLEEDAKISITEDLEGNPFSENRIIFIAKLAAYTSNRDNGLQLHGNEDGGVIAAWGLKTGTSGFYHFHEITATGAYAYDRYSAGTSIGPSTSNSFYCYSIPFKGKITGVSCNQGALFAGSEFWLYAVR